MILNEGVVGKVAFGMSECTLQLPGGMKLPGKGGIVLSGVCEELSGGEGWVKERAKEQISKRDSGERAQSVKDLPCRYKNLGSDLQNPRKEAHSGACLQS